MMLRRLANGGVGLAAAAFAAAGVQLAFAYAARGARAWAGAEGFPEILVLVAAQTFLFSLPLALPLILIAEFNGARAWRNYAWAGFLISASGWLVLITSAGGEGLRLVNGLAMLAFAAAGLGGGTVYWLAAGRFSGGPDSREDLQRSRGEKDFAITRL